MTAVSEDTFTPHDDLAWCHVCDVHCRLTVGELVTRYAEERWVVEDGGTRVVDGDLVVVNFRAWCRPCWEGGALIADAMAVEEGGTVTDINWVVLFKADGETPTVILPYDSEADARTQYNALTVQWSDVLLCRVVRDAGRPHNRQPEGPAKTQEHPSRKGCCCYQGCVPGDDRWHQHADDPCPVHPNASMEPL